MDAIGLGADNPVADAEGIKAEADVNLTPKN